MKSVINKKHRLVKDLSDWKEKLNIKSLSIDEIRSKIRETGSSVIVQDKIDGQTVLMEYDESKKSVKFATTGGRIITDLPVQNEIYKILKNKDIKYAKMVGELAASKDGKILPFNECESIIKNPKADKTLITWHPYEIIKLDNKEFDFKLFNVYRKTWPILKELFKNGKRVKYVDSYEDKIDAINKAWNEFVKKRHSEGIVVRTSKNEIYKVKPVFTYDLVIIAVGDKRKKNWPKKKIGIVLVAFMDKDKNFRVAGNVASGFSDEERIELFKWAMKNKVGEDDRYVWVKPEKIIEVQWERTSIKPMPAYSYDKEYKLIGNKPSGTIEKPRFIKWRIDKIVNPFNLRLEQIPNFEKYEDKIKKISSKYIKSYNLNFIKFLVKDYTIPSVFIDGEISDIDKIEIDKYNQKLIILSSDELRKLGFDITELYDIAVLSDYIASYNKPIITELLNKNDIEYTIINNINELTSYLTNVSNSNGRVINADYPDNPDDIVISREEHILKLRSITELDVWNYYTGNVVTALLRELKNKNLFVVIKPKGVLKSGEKPIYIRHPYDGRTKFIRINNHKDFEKYHSGRTVEYHVTMDAETDYLIVDYDPADNENFNKTKKIIAEIYDKLKELDIVEDIEIRYTGKRGFHVLAKINKKMKIDDARKFLKSWLKDNFSNHKDVILGESPEGNKGAIGVSPMKLNGGHVAKWSLRISGCCCVPVERSELLNFEREDATLDKTYERLNKRKFIYNTGREKLSSKYDIEKLKPNYKGRFVIHEHDASKLHWDLRLEFPVDDVYEALPKEYRTENTKHEKGVVLRSWAIPKHKFPTDRPLLATETENHNIEYLDFEGEIPEGEYGAGTVKIKDIGTYTLDKIDYDKKYVFTLHGKKYKGTYALIKLRGKTFLWVKKKNQKEASAIDYPRPIMNPVVWDISQHPPKLRREIKIALLKPLFTYLTDKLKLPKINTWITNIYLSGSMTSNIAQETGDVDVDLKFKPSVVNLTAKELNELIKPITHKEIPNTTLMSSYMFLDPEDEPVSEGVYDIINDRWIRGPVLVPTNFDPDEAFRTQKMIAIKIGNRIDILIKTIFRLVKDLKKVDNYIKLYNSYSYKRITLLYLLCKACNELKLWHKWIWKLPEIAKTTEKPYYPAFDFSRNWEQHYIILKYLARYEYHHCIENLYDLFDQDDPYLKILKSYLE